MADHIPTGLLRRMREKRVRAGDVFFRLQRVNGVFGFVAFVGNGEEPHAVYGAGGLSGPRISAAKIEPCGVEQVDGQEQDQRDTQKSRKSGDR